MDPCLALAHDAFNRMKRAHERGTGCHLTAEMIAALSVTFMGEVWSDDDPRKPAALSPETDR
jgi:hypothetical protein